MTINNTNSKNESFDLIICGLAFQFLPLLICVLVLLICEGFSLPFPRFLISLSISAIAYGYIPLLKGCRLYSYDKGYASKWGWFGLLSILGLSFLLLFPEKRTNFYSEGSLGNDSIKFPFNKLNIPEFLLYYSIAFPILILTIFIIILLIIGLFSLVKGSDFIDLFSNATWDILPELYVTITYLFIGLFLFRYIRILGFDVEKFGILNFGSLKPIINWKLIILIVFLNYAFAWGFNSLISYYISFIYPDFIENSINELEFTNVIGLISWSFSAIVFAPLLEELICRGIILQKWAMKWGIKAGIVTSSLLFAICHLRFDIVSLFIAGTILSVLYFKTGNLIVPILCHSLYNTIVTIFMIGRYYSSSNVDFVSVNDYRVSMEPLLGQKAIVAAISFAVIMFFLYRNFPKQDDILPYYRNSK
ncbi:MULTISPECIES: type II CAAX endopeptidase family protein [unclassified Moorena]|uniref:CPBP family intramembrane glutamic endopeptidase n=1 Tax=unclassified Moorena TaxID=2683338 RepID=UPI0013C59B09|nr:MULTISPECIES: type II CAAX endopeptidase family protein [unclassified Moorena]NEP30603.1 CPBP family intramembrane metalloprotease [Moorena sp. SIO3B2]NEP65826.1 CPBP family intramembrane metalloprotease [Moorena sp. SIO3A5]